MNIYDLKAVKRDGSELKLSDLKGKVLLVVNTATGCGFTPQYEALETLYKKYHEQGLEILDFPCDQFGHQAPGNDDEIHEFCTAKYQTTFDQLKKIEVNGENEDRIFTYLKTNATKEYIKGLKNNIAMKGVSKLSTTCKKENDIKWNFTKFVVDKTGKVVARFEPTADMKELEACVEKLL